MERKIQQPSVESPRRVLLYYAFDWDDNILFMPTKIHMQKKEGETWTDESISTHKFAAVRGDSQNWRIKDGDPSKAFCEFRDTGPRGDSAFYEDVRYSCQNKDFGPSWNDFIECLINGSLFSIITARGHEDQTLRKGVEWIIDEFLSEEEKYSMYNHLLKFNYLFFSDVENLPRIPKELYNNGKFSTNTLVSSYLDECSFVGVSAPSREGSAQQPEEAKKIALLEFKERVNKWAGSLGVKAVVGFSDDDIKNVRTISQLFDQVDNEKFPSIEKLVLKSTGNPQNLVKTVWDFKQNESNFPTFDGLQASVIPFTKWNNMTQRLYPKGPHGRLDDNLNDLTNKLGQIRDLSKGVKPKKRRVFSKKKRPKKRTPRKLSTL
jgi:hypothetical protein